MSLSLTESKLITVKDTEERVEQPTSYPQPGIWSIRGSQQERRTPAGPLRRLCSSTRSCLHNPSLQSFQQDIPLGEKTTVLIIFVVGLILRVSLYRSASLAQRGKGFSQEVV